MNFEIKVIGELDRSWSDWLGDVKITTARGEDGAIVTTLRVDAIDQPALFGVLDRIRDLNLCLLSVKRVDDKKFSSKLRL
jgi:hypothetical protein